MARPTTNVTTTTRRDSRSRRWVLLVVVGAAIAPFVYDYARICINRWHGMLGNGGRYEVATPALDMASDALKWMRRTFWLTMDPYFRDPAWQPGPTIVLGVGWAVVTMYLMRAARHGR